MASALPEALPRGGRATAARWWPVAAFAVRRVLGMLGMLLVVSFAVFLLQDLAPGSLEDTLIDKRSRPSPERVAFIRERYRLDEPLVVRYAAWVGNAARFDFGESITGGQPVTTVLAQRAAITAQLVLLAFPIYLFCGIGLGVVAALRKDTLVDRGTVALALLAYSAPAFVSGLLLAFVFGAVLGWFPLFGPGDAGINRLTHLVLPAATVALASFGSLVKVTRASMIDQIEADYVTFARARGVPEPRIVLGKALRNGLIPIAAVGSNQLVGMITGVVLVEVVFALPGLGSLLVESVRKSNVPVVQGLTLLTAAAIILLNFGTDLLYRAIDPRVALGDAR